MRQKPLNEKELQKIIVQARKGKTRSVFFCWYKGGGDYILTKITLQANTELKEHDLKNITHDWNGFRVNSSAHNIFCENTRLYDNYWMAYRHVLLANKDMVKSA